LLKIFYDDYALGESIQSMSVLERLLTLREWNRIVKLCLAAD